MAELGAAVTRGAAELSSQPQSRTGDDAQDHHSRPVPDSAPSTPVDSGLPSPILDVAAHGRHTLVGNEAWQRSMSVESATLVTGQPRSRSWKGTRRNLCMRRRWCYRRSLRWRDTRRRSRSHSPGPHCDASWSRCWPQYWPRRRRHRRSLSYPMLIQVQSQLAGTICS